MAMNPASKYDTASIKTFDHEVLERKFKNQLLTKLDMNQFITWDYSLTENPGMKKIIRTYVGTGNVEDVAMGQKNTGLIGSDFYEAEYEVKTTQGTVKHYDEQQMNDPFAIDKAIEHLATQIVNDNTKKIVGEMAKGTNKVYNFDYSFNMIVDALAGMPEETNEPMFMLVARKDVALIQKKLKDDLKYIEDFVRTAQIKAGYIGHVAATPIYASDAVPTGCAYLATPEAVTGFMKKNVGLETSRDIEYRANTMVGNVVKVIALTNNDKIVALRKIADPRTGYSLVAEQPDDWATKATTDYYTFNNAEDKLELNTSTVFVANKFYHED